MRARCTDCGRVRRDTLWLFEATPAADYFPGLCGVCIERRRNAAVARWNRAARQKVAAPARPDAGAVETFKGFTGEEK